MRIIYLLIVFLTVFYNCKKDNIAEYDIVVYGATPAGIIAAYSAASTNQKILIIEQTDHIGGMNTSGLTTAEVEHMTKESITGFAREFYIKMGKEFPDGYFETFSMGRKLNFKKGDPAFFFESHVAEQVFLEMLEKKNVEVIFNKYVTNVKTKENVIKSIELNDSNYISGKIFIDCSYEGDLMAKAGVSYTYGRESISTYNESLAGIRLIDDTIFTKTVDAQDESLPLFSKYDTIIEGKGDKKVMTFNFRPTMTRVEDNKKDIYPPEDFDSSDFDFLADYLENYPETNIWDLIGIYKWGNNKAEFNNKQSSVISLGLFGGNTDYIEADYAKRKDIYNAHKYYTLGFLYFLANDSRVSEKLRKQTREWGYAKDEYTDNNNFPYYLYIREARRMIGEYVHKQSDIFINREKDDAITLGSHWIDCHHVQRIAISDSSFTNEGRIWEKVKKPYEISYKSIIPIKSECVNLLVPVCLSASHVGFCSIRVEPTWMQLGHVAGTAAAIAANMNKTVQDIDITLLQETLRKQGMIIKHRNIDLINDDNN